MLSYMVHCKPKEIKTPIASIRAVYYSTMSVSVARWAFNVKQWQPTPEEMSLSLTFIQKEEKDRINRFVFQNDAKASLIGRLMLRKFIHLSTGIPYNDIRLSRDGHGKPVLVGREGVSPFFNVSHQGDFVVLVGDKENKVGIDVMKIEAPANKNIPEFFRIMRRQFSSQEWNKILSYHTENDQVASFYRHWCLKESYVKNIGLGITVNLGDLGFKVTTDLIGVNEIVRDTVLFEKHIMKTGWIFEETLLDEKHAVAVAIQADEVEAKHFTFMSYKELIQEAEMLHN